MRTKVFLVALALTLVGASALAAEPSEKPKAEAKVKLSDLPKSEPIMCYRTLGELDKEIMAGLAVKLCAGTRDAAATLSCYAMASVPIEQGGLGLVRGMAIDLCRSNSLE